MRRVYVVAAAAAMLLGVADVRGTADPRPHGAGSVGQPERPSRRVVQLVTTVGEGRTSAAHWLATLGLDRRPLTTVPSDASTKGFLGGDFAVVDRLDAVSPTEDLDSASVAYNPARNEYLVVWHAFVRETATDIYDQMLDAGAKPTGSNFSISASDLSEFAPLVSWDRVSGRFLVAWWKYHSATDSDVWACTVSGTGTVAGDWFTVTGVNDVQRAAKLSRGATNGVVLIVWQDFRNANYDIYGRLFEMSSATNCSPGPERLCLNEARFSVEVSWRSFEGDTGTGQAVPLTSDTGYFWFFKETNVELVVKVLDGRSLNDHYWVFYGALSDVDYTLTVTDTDTGEVVRYHNPQGQMASVGDTEAFHVP